MKKYILSLCLFLSVIAYAQDSDDEILPSDRPHITARAALDITIPGNWVFDDNSSVKMYRPGAGFAFGVQYMLPFAGNFYFEPGLQFYYNTYRYDGLDFSNAAGDIIESDPKIVKTGFRLPLMCGYKFDIFTNGSLGVFTGPQPSIGTSARINLTANEVADVWPDHNLYDDVERRFGLAWNVGAVVMLGHWQIDMTGSFGLLDMRKGKAISWHEYRFSIGLGYMF